MVKLQGSVPTNLADMRSLGPAPADERCDITVLVRRRDAGAIEQPRHSGVVGGENRDLLSALLLLEEFGNPNRF